MAGEMLTLQFIGSVLGFYFHLYVWTFSFGFFENWYIILYNNIYCFIFGILCGVCIEYKKKFGRRKEKFFGKEKKEEQPKKEEVPECKE